GRQQSPMNGKAHGQERPDDQARHADDKNGEKTADVVTPLAAAHGGVEDERNADAFGEAEGEEAESHRDGQSLGDDVVDGVVAILKRGTEVAHDQSSLEPVHLSVLVPVIADSEVAEVLLVERLVEVILGLEIALDLRGSGRALPVERPSGCDVQKHE